MKTSKFSETQIVAILKQQEAGVKVADICREHGISAATFYKWRSRYGGMDASMLRRVKELEQENARLKQMYAEVQMDRQQAMAAPAAPEAARPLSELLAPLPPGQREVITLMKGCGMTLEEVARATCSTVGAVKQKAHRAYERLRAARDGALSGETNDL